MADFLEDSKDLATWLQRKINGIAIRSDDRSRVSGTCFDVVLQHQVAITILIENQLIGSAFALARAAFEAYVRGIWLRDCATQLELQRFLGDKLDKGFGQLIREVECREAYSEGILSSSKRATWQLLNSYTHTGVQQILLHSTGDAIEASHTEEEIVQVLRFVDSYALMAGVEIMHLAHSLIEHELEEFRSKAKSYGNPRQENDA